jgi:hypothetical protein
MFKLSRAQTTALDDAAGLRFLDGLRRELEQEHQEMFEDQPLFVRRCMVANGVTAAARCGFEEAGSLAVFVSLQCEFSPDFHTHPRVAEVLARPGEEEQRLEAVLALPEALWEQIDIYGSELAWFDPPLAVQRNARIAFKACGALPAIMETHSEAQALALFTGVSAAAARHGIDWEEGLAVFAAALAVYGKDFDRNGGPRWRHQVVTLPPLPAETVVGLLRYRLSLDFDCLI